MEWIFQVHSFTISQAKQQYYVTDIATTEVSWIQVTAYPISNGFDSLLTNNTRRF